MSSWLNDGKPKETVHRLTSIGVHRDVAEQAIVEEAPLIQWEAVRTESGQPLAIMFLPCTALGAHVYLMSQNANWRVSDTVDLECYYDDSVSIEIASIRREGVDELLVHHASEARGTGFSQQNFKVYGISNGKLKPVLNTEEILSADPPEGPARRERSYFVIMPSNNERSHLVIEQTHSVLVGDKLSVQRRYFRWAADKGRYVPSSFIAVRSSDE